MGGARKPFRRPEKRLQLVWDRLKQAQDKLYEIKKLFPAEVFEKHENNLRAALLAKKVNWRELNPSVEYVLEWRSHYSQFLRYIGKAVRSGLKLKPITSADEKRIRELKNIIDEMDGILNRIHERRKKEIGI